MLKIQENIILAPFTTFKIGGPARYFVKVETVEELQEALVTAREKEWPIFVLAGGSNLIISSQGFAGLVIQIVIESHQIDGHKITAGAATMMSTLVDETVAAGLAGLEWAGGLPGTFGGAIRGNAGAFGGEMKDNIESVTTVNHHSGELTNWTNADCQFEYRGSVFKSQPHEVIIEATLALAPGDSHALRETADSRIQYRQEKHPLEYPNSGSIFKNTPVEKVPAEILPHFQDSIKTDPFPVVPTAKIIADAQLSGLQVGQVQVSTKHTNYIVNLGGGTGEEIVELIEKVRAAVREKFGIELEVEPELVGF